MAELINTNEQSDREFDLTIKLDGPSRGLLERLSIGGIEEREAAAKITELEAQLAEANETIAHLRKAKNCYYDCVDKAEANQRIATAQDAAMNVVRPLVEQAEARAKAAKDACANLGAELAMATNALPARRVGALVDAFRKLEEVTA